MPFFAQKSFTISRLGGRYPAMPSSREMHTRRIPFLSPNSSERMLSVTMLSFPPDTATPTVSPRSSEASRRTSRRILRSTYAQKCSAHRWAPL